MASYIETTALSLRKGSTDQHMNFTGVLGEVTFDTGYTTAGSVHGTDINTTLRIHNGVTKGGIPLARADFRNITTKSLAENRQYFDDKNLAYANLGNIAITNDLDERERIVDTLSEYGIATLEELNNIIDNLALRDMSNVLSGSLAEGRGRGTNGNLAYADTHNINTKDLTDTVLHSGIDGNLPLAYAILSNVDTTNLTLSVETRPAEMTGPVLATNTFSNVDNSVWENIFNNPDLGFNLETTNNKDISIPQSNDDIIGGHYPETAAVKIYVDNAIQTAGNAYLQTDFSNATSYAPLYSNTSAEYWYDTNPENIIVAGKGFVDDNLYATNESLNYNEYLKLIINEVDENGYIIETPELQANIVEICAKSNLDLSTLTQISIQSETGGIATFSFSSVESVLAPGTYIYNLGHIINQTNGGFEANVEYTAIERIEIPVILQIKIESVDTDGAILSFRYVPESSSTFLEKTITLTSPSHASEDATQIDLKSINILPSIGGAGLLRSDLSNLKGMSNIDKGVVEGTAWRIRNDEPIPALDTEIVDKAQYSNIANNGAVWDLVKTVYTQNLDTVTDHVSNCILEAPNGIWDILYDAGVHLDTKIGIVALIPDGRNAKGLLKSIPITMTAVKRITLTDHPTWNNVFIKADGTLLQADYVISRVRPTDNTDYNLWYNPDTNIMYESGQTAGQYNAYSTISAVYIGSVDTIKEEYFPEQPVRFDMGNSLSSGKGSGIPDWEENKIYVTTPSPSKVYYDGAIYFCKVTHTSESTFDLTKWALTNIPDQTGKEDMVLSTNGETLYWADDRAGLLRVTSGVTATETNILDLDPFVLTDKAQISAVNVGNSVLLGQTYELSADGTQVILSENIEAGMYWEIKIINKASVAFQSIYQKQQTATTNTIVLKDNIVSYNKTITANATLSFDISNLSQASTDIITFELKLTMGSTLRTVNFSNVTWLNGNTPSMPSTNKNYLFVFRSYDGGTSWVGNIQGYY